MEREIAKLAEGGERRSGTWHVPRNRLPKEVNQALDRLAGLPDEELEREARNQGVEPVKGGTPADALAGLLVGCALAMRACPVPPSIEPLQWAVRLGSKVREEMTNLRNQKKREAARREKDKRARRKKRKETGR